ncbi:hypothetical protein HYR54_13390 [Candidatus Acetothermia bacterium]|nr:hypothetical protein [Candidatus Acetothermia bacterium]
MQGLSLTTASSNCTFTADCSGGVFQSNAGVGINSPAVFAENFSTGSGIALWGRTHGTDSALVLDNIGGSGDLIKAFASGGNLRFQVTNSGNVLADGSFSGPADFAEMMEVAGSKTDFEPGDVLVIGTDGKLIKATQAYATNLAGVYSTKPGFLGDTEIAEKGIEATEKPSGKARVPVAVIGIVPVKVSAENGTIHAGDMLTTSNTPGYAMKCTDKLQCFGAVLGKALGSLEQGKGVITVLVTLR